MASFISSTQAAELESQIVRHFDTFKRDIVVFKQPIRTFVETSSNPLPGYREESIEGTYTTTIVSGVFSAMIQYNKRQETFNLVDSKNIVAKGEVLIKVEEDCKEYIKNGANEAFLIDGILYNQVADEAVSKFLGLTYYIFGLERTN
jgi:hypothetical protein